MFEFVSGEPRSDGGGEQCGVVERDAVANRGVMEGCIGSFRDRLLWRRCGNGRSVWLSGEMDCV